MRGVGSAPKSIVFFSNSIARSREPEKESRKRGIESKKSFERDERCRPVRETRALTEAICYKWKMKIWSSSIFAVFFAISVLAESPPVEKIAENELPSLLAIYKDIHSHPELSAHEEHTSALIAQQLRAAGCAVTEHFGIYNKPELEGYGVIGIMTNGDGKDVHVMHACGHDAHIAAFIGTARALAKLKNQWHGTIVFLAQPAEELGTGARALLKDGLYDRFGKPNFALGFHDKADLENGCIGVTQG